MRQARVAALEAEAAQLRAARERLEAAVEEEAAARRRADDGRARAEAERARLQRGRDQLAMVLRVSVRLLAGLLYKLNRRRIRTLSPEVMCGKHQVVRRLR